MRKDRFPRLQLQQAINRAFKGWHNLEANAGLFEGLYLFQTAQQKTGNHRAAVQNLLLAALEALSVERPQDAGLLRQVFLTRGSMRTFARSRNISLSTAYRYKDEAIRQLARILWAQEVKARATWQIALEKRLDLPPPVQLVGAEAQFKRLLDLVTTPGAPWVICINGLGGIGKTALANSLVRRPQLISYFRDVAWVSAKQQGFSPAVELENLPDPALQVETLVDILLRQLNEPVTLAQSSPQKMATLTELLKRAACLIVIDNLETVVDYEALLPTVLKLSNPSKFLLTSRHNLLNQPGVFNLTLPELSQADAVRLLRQDAAERGLSAIAEAPEAQLGSIYEVVGGNPLALKLVVGQLSALSLAQVLENLKQAKGKKVEDLYTFIYWQAWDILDTAGRKTLLMMSLAQQSTIEQLLILTHLPLDDLSQALQRLAELSLVQVGGDLAERRYTIHRLTETFLLTEAIEWKTPAR